MIKTVTADEIKKHILDMNLDEFLLGPDQIEEKYGINAQEVRILMKNGHIPAIKLGPSFATTSFHIEQYLKYKTEGIIV